MNANLILDNANIVDVELGTSSVGSIAIEGDRIRAVGSADEIAGLRNERTQIIDLANKTVVPGFIDAHAHLTATGFSLIEINVREARSIQDIQDLVAERAVAQPPDTLVRGWGLQEHLLRENRFPTRKELDAVAPDHHVRIFREDGHASVVNSKALRYLGYTTEAPGADVEGGELTGVLRAKAQAKAGRKFREFETSELRQRGLRAAAAQALQVGLTTVQTLEGSDEQPHEDYLEVAGIISGLPIRTVLWYQTTQFDRLDGLHLPRIGGCIMVDGAPGSYTGALFDPYSDNPGTRGTLYFTDEALDAFVLEAHRRGYQVALHATCQRAIEQALRAYENALDACPKTDHRLRLEHVYGLPTADQFERMGVRRIICSTQPAFLHYRMEMYYRRFGHRWRQVHPHRLALEHGVTIAGGSDSFVTPLYPLLGIHCAVNHPVEEQRVEVREALRWFTCNAAYAAFEEDVKGTITPGKLADLTVLGRNILTENALTIKDIPVVMTMVGGRTRYSAEEAAPDEGDKRSC
jgi:predicted amidohydrolase YtcJ